MWMADTAEVMATMEVTMVTMAEDRTSIFSATATDEAGMSNTIANEAPRVVGLGVPVVGTVAMAAGATAVEAGAMEEAEDDVNPHDS
jgi:hypothetical protein